VQTARNTAEGTHPGPGSPYRGRSAVVYRGGTCRPRHHCRTAQQATVMELQRIGIKLFADSSAPVPVREFIPVFHSWIQKQAIENHLLIDVHNYSHIHNGPGILLVAQEGNFSIDSAEGRMSLLYFRKKPGEGVASVLKTALAACKLMESEPALGGRMRFRTDEMLIVTNDRLLAPNDDPTFE